MMSDDGRWIPPDEWATIVANVPLVSVDLIVKHEGGVLLGLRVGEPAKGELFVPGGTVLKNERLSEAVQRVARAELGCEVDVLDELGAFEHFYDTSEVQGVDTKHYVAHASVVEPRGSVDATDDQHAAVQVFHPPFENLHSYVDRYLEHVPWTDE